MKLRVWHKFKYDFIFISLSFYIFLLKLKREISEIYKNE